MPEHPAFIWSLVIKSAGCSCAYLIGTSDVSSLNFLIVTRIWTRCWKQTDSIMRTAPPLYGPFTVLTVCCDFYIDFTGAYAPVQSVLMRTAYWSVHRQKSTATHRQSTKSVTLSHPAKGQITNITNLFLYNIVYYFHFLHLPFYYILIRYLICLYILYLLSYVN